MLSPLEPDSLASVELLTERLRLRPLGVSDADDMAFLVTPAISRWTASLPERLTIDQAAERIRAIELAMASGDDMTLAIEPRRGQRFIGWIGLRRLKADPRRANLGYWMGEFFHGRGWMREAAQAFLPASWSWLDVDVVEASVHPDNAPSIAVLQGLGMKLVGERASFVEMRGCEETCLHFEIARPPRPGVRRV